MQPVLLFFALCDYTDALHGLSFEIFFSKLFTLSPETASKSEMLCCRV